MLSAEMVIRFLHPEALVKGSFLLSEALALPEQYLVSSSFLQSPGHQSLSCALLCVWHGTFSAVALFTFFFSLNENSLVLQNTFHWSPELPLKMEIRSIRYDPLFPLVLPAEVVRRKPVGIINLARFNRALEYLLLRVVPVASQLESPTAECHSGKS